MIHHCAKKGFVLAVCLLLSCAYGRHTIQTVRPVIGAEEVRDLELFGESRGNCLFDIINRTKTIHGTRYLATILGTPLTEKKALIKRQKAISFLCEEKNRESLKKILEQYKKNESCMHHHTQKPSTCSVQGPSLLHENFYYPTTFSSLNASTLALTVGLAVPIAVSALPTMVHALDHWTGHPMCHHHAPTPDHAHEHAEAHDHHTCTHEHHHQPKIKPSSWYTGVIQSAALVSIIAHASGTLWSAKELVTERLPYIVSLQQHLIELRSCIEACYQAYHFIAQSTVVSDEIALSTHPYSNELIELLSLLQTSTFAGTASLWSQYGRILRAHSLWLRVTDEIEERLITPLAHLDALSSIALLYSEEPHRYHSAEYCETTHPYLSLTNAWHPLVATKEQQGLSLTSGSPQHGDISNDTAWQHAIITGDNAAGKTTVITTIATAVILAQTLTIVPAEHCQLTPFNAIRTSIKNSYALQQGISQHVADIQRAETIMSHIETAAPQEKILVVADELFAHTKPEKGVALAHTYINELCQQPTTLSFITTHYDSLAAIAQTRTSCIHLHATKKEIAGEKIYRLQQQ